MKAIKTYSDGSELHAVHILAVLAAGAISATVTTLVGNWRANRICARYNKLSGKTK